MRVQWKKLCSALLAAILFVTAVPGTKVTSYAAENGREDVQTMDMVSGEKDIVAMEETTGSLALSYMFKDISSEEEQQEILQQMKVQSVDGTVDYDINNIPFHGEESLTFHLEFPEGYTITGSRFPKGYFRFAKDYANNNYTIRSGYKGETLYGTCEITIVIGRVRDTELYVEYPDTIESVEVLYNNEKVNIINDKAWVSNEGAVTVKVKPQKNQIVSAKYETEDSDSPMTYYDAVLGEDGFYYYDMGKVNSDTNMVFTTEESADLSIRMDEGISGYVYGVPEDSYGDGVSLEDGKILKAKKASNLSIYLAYDDIEKFNNNNLKITSTTADGTVTDISWEYDEDYGENVCKYQVTEAATLSFQWVPKTAYVVDFEATDVEIYEFYYYHDDDWTEVEQREQYSEDSKLSVCEGESITFGVPKSVAYDLEVIVNGNTDEALDYIYAYDDGDAGIYYIYRYQPMEDATISINVIPKKQCYVNVECENATIYSVYPYESSYDISGDVWENRNIYEGNASWFAVRCDSTRKIESVQLTDGENSIVEHVGTIMYDEEEIYYVYKIQPTADTSIVVNVVEKDKYTLKFEASDVYIEGDGGIFTTGEVSEFELYEGKHTFCINLSEAGDRVKLVTKGTQQETREIIPYYNADACRYEYSLELSADTTVTVLTEAKEQYNVEINGENVSIEKVTGSFTNEGNSYSVYDGETFSFQVIPQEGYELVQVNIAGEQVQKLFPGYNGSGKFNVYAVKVGADMDIQIETVKKAASIVSFETNNASLSSANIMDMEGNYIAYKNEPFVFTVEAEEGYVLDSVSANGEELEAIYEPYSDTSYYQVEIEEDINIVVNAEVPESHQVIFVDEDIYSDIGVWVDKEETCVAPEVEEFYTTSYTVSSNDIIWFEIYGSVGSAARVVCTYENGETKTLNRICHNGQEGYYLGNVTEDIQINVYRGETYAVHFRSLKEMGEKFMPLTGVGTYPETIYVPSNESFDFKVVSKVKEGLELSAVKVIGPATATGSLETGIYHVEPRSGKKGSDVTVSAGSRRVIQAEYVFDYPQEEVALTVLVDGEEVPTVNGALTALTTQDITVKLKPLKDKLLSLYGCQRTSAEIPDSVEEDGTLVYELTYSDISNISDGHLRVEADEYYSVEFDKDDVSIIQGIFNGYSDEGEPRYVWKETSEAVKVKKGSEFVFRVDTQKGYAVSEVTLEGETAGTVTQKKVYEEDENGSGVVYQCYVIKSEKDTVVNITTEQLPGHDYKFVYDPSKVDLYMGYYSYYENKSDYEIVWEEGSSEYRKIIQDGVYNRVMFRAVPKEGYTLSLVSTTEDRSGLIPTTRDYWDGVRYYYLDNTEDATITIVADEIASYNVIVECGDGIREVYVGGNALTFEDGSKKTVEVSNADEGYIKIYTVTKWIEDGNSEIELYNIVSVTADGEELEIEPDYDDSRGAYYIPNYVFHKDTTIVVKTEVNPKAFNTGTIVTNGEKDSFKAYHYVETEDKDGNVQRYKEYLDIEKDFYFSGRNNAIGIEMMEGHELEKVEFIRNGKVKTLTANEEGLYPIWYPFSLGLEGTLNITVCREKVKPESVIIAGIAGGKVSQDVDTMKDYELNFAPENCNLFGIGVEVLGEDGKLTDVVQAEIIDGKLRLTTAAQKGKENAATVKIYDEDPQSGERNYLEGGTFNVTTVNSKAVEEGSVKAEVLGVNDASVTLGLTAPEGLLELNQGAYYYKVQIVPQTVEGTEIPAEILNATKNPYYVAKEGETQKIQLSLNTNGVGKGQAWKYEVKVSMVQTTDKNDTVNVGSKELFESKQTVLNNIQTKTPYYQEKVTFSNQLKQVYTIQEEVAAAKVVFDENNSDPRIAEVKDITELNGKGSALTVWAKEDVVYVSVPSDAMTGKHTIEVTLAAPEHMNPAQGTVIINVVKGIETMAVTVPSMEVYKQNGKAVTIKANLVYNQDTTAPKTKKAQWEIVKANGEALTSKDALYGKVTVKNGTITVDKKYEPTEKLEDNQFCVKVSAADYEGNKVSALSEVITLLKQPVEIGGIYILSPTAGGYKNVVKDSSIITTDVLENAFVAVFKKEAAEKEIYTQEDVKLWSISSKNLTYKISNKAVAVEKEDVVTLKASKTAKNVKLTVTTNDGGKKKAELKFTIDYAKPEALALEMRNGDQVLGETGTKEVSFAGTTNTKVTVTVKQKNKEKWTDLEALVNHKLGIKGGKILSSDPVKGVYEVIVSGKTATLTLENKTTGVKAKDKYVLTNTAYSEAKAPKIKTSEKLICGVLAGRSITYTLSGKYDYKNKYVMVETDWTSKNKKTQANYEQFEAASISSNHLIPVTSDGKFTLYFNENPIPAGSYKLKLTLGTGTEDKNFVADAKPVSVTLKAVKPKVIKGSYSPTKSYKMEAKAGASVQLTGKGKNLVENSLLYYDLKNVNIKGNPNNFLSYFELKDGKLFLRSDVTDEEITYLKSKSGKNDLNAYISYKVAHGDDGYGNPFTTEKTIKLTIKLK